MTLHKNLRCPMINETILAIIIAFAVSAVLCPVVIPFLHKLKFGQQVRDDGPQTHLKKAGTPTMGDLIILSSIIITSMFYLWDYPKMIPVLFVTVGFGIIGFLDDYIKIVMKRSEGLEAYAEAFGADHHHRGVYLLPGQFRGGEDSGADPLHRRI